MSLAKSFVIGCLGVPGLMLSLSGPATADWPTNPLVNLPVCTAASYQTVAVLAPDGRGGAFAAWTDMREGGTNTDAYAQRLWAGGSVGWTPDGVGVCTLPSKGQVPLIVPDGEGGAIIAWQDFRSDSYWDIYAQRLSAAGTVLWDSLPVCTADRHQFLSDILSDGAGGAFVAWYDQRNGGNGFDDIYVQHISPNGSMWATDGVALCTATRVQQYPKLASDGAGGVIVVWLDSRENQFQYYVAAQRVSAGGIPQWTADGVRLCPTWTGLTEPPGIVTDGAGGAIVTWIDPRSSVLNTYAQRISPAGALQWGASGVPICVAAGNQFTQRVVSDGAGGAIVTWADYRFANGDIYAQKVNAVGTIQWSAPGVVVCNYYDNQIQPVIVTDGAGGAIIAWSDQRDTPGTGNIYASRVSSAGAPQWTYGGNAVCTAAGDQQQPAIIADGSGGAIIAWDDSRGGQSDIYAQRIRGNGQLGGTLVSAPGIGAIDFSLDPILPNPSRGRDVAVHFALTGTSAATLEVLDLAGRRVVAQEVGSLGAGRHTVDLRGAGLKPGVYLVRLATGGRAVSRKFLAIQ